MDTPGQVFSYQVSIHAPAQGATQGQGQGDP